MKVIFFAYALFNLILSIAVSFARHSKYTSRIAAVIIAGALLTYIQFEIRKLESSRLPYGPLLIPSWLLYVRAAHLVFRPDLYNLPAREQQDVDLHNGPFQKAATSLLNLWAFRTFPRKIKNLPNFSDDDTNYVPSRRRILAVEAARFAICWLYFELISRMPPPNIASAFTATHERTIFRLHEINGEEVTSRVITVALTWISIWALLVGLYSLSALIFVGSSLSRHSSWPPPFGSLRGSYTLRRFWGVTWHQTFRMPLEETADFIVSRVLNIPKGTKISRYTKLIFAFSLSGLAHLLNDIAGGIPVRESGSLVFFALQALGIIFEDAIQALCRKSGLQGRWIRLIGFVWVILFLLWTSPGWIYPSVRYRRNGIDFIIPYRILG